ncbi:hypothetical protein K501DRAFT_274774 [Backusella circina FSU 941]|nr:hypothetical protein K501DRAFT_274774 [Backusella circina FSU 941]
MTIVFLQVPITVFDIALIFPNICLSKNNDFDMHVVRSKFFEVKEIPINFKVWSRDSEIHWELLRSIMISYGLTSIFSELRLYYDLFRLSVQRFIRVNKQRYHFTIKIVVDNGNIQGIKQSTNKKHMSLFKICNLFVYVMLFMLFFNKQFLSEMSDQLRI